MSLNWMIAIGSAVFWALGVGWYLRTTNQRTHENDDKIASHEATAMAWSESRTLDVMERFPNSVAPVLIHAGQAVLRKDFDEAARRYQLAIDIDGRNPKGYLGAVRALRNAGRHDEAEALIQKARRRLPRDQEVLAEVAWTARFRGDWPEAVRRWAAYRKRFPKDKVGYAQGAEALRKAGRAADADALVADAAARFAEPAAETAAGG